MIVFEHLSFSFSGSGKLFTDLSLIIDEASSVCLAGREGAGKSAFLKIVKGIMPPETGCVRFDFSTQIAFQNVGYLGGDPYDSFVGITVEEEIVFGPENMPLTVDEIRNRLNYVLDLTGLAGFENRLIDSLSGGEQQKLALAAVLVMEPKILIIDDAFSMMDPPSRRKHWAWINKLRKNLGLTVLYSTNKIEELNYADRVLFLDEKSHELIFDGAPGEFLTSGLCDDWIELENGLDKFCLSLSNMGFHDLTSMPHDILAILSSNCARVM
jgi:energy-coupling factor transporter ATP-binding protein EcfA2